MKSLPEKTNLFRNKNNLNLVSITYIVVTVLISIQLYFRDNVLIDKYYYFVPWNNYLIFKETFIHLINYDDLYSLNRYSRIDYWYWDFKYSPSFSVLMAPFSYLPDWLGMTLWNLLNSCVLLFSIRQLPWLSNNKKALLLILILIEHITATQNCQSNSLIAGLAIFYLSNLQQNRVFLAALALVISIFIKPFTVVLLLLLPLKNFDWKFFGYFSGLFVILLLLPLLFTSINRLEDYYYSWFEMLEHDHSQSLGMSVVGFTKSWFNILVPKNTTVLVGFLMILFPSLYINNYRNQQPLNRQILLFCLCLIWMVIFNHKAESPTFIICLVGIGIWFSIRAKNASSLTLISIVLIFTSLSPTDIFPASIKKSFLIPYNLKVFPCIVAWFIILYEYILYNPKNFFELQKEIMKENKQTAKT